MTMPELFLQRYPWNLNMFKNVDENVAFLTQNFDFEDFYIVNYKLVTFAENPQLERNS